MKFFVHFSAKKNRNQIQQIFPTGKPSLPLGHSRGAYIINTFFSTFQPIKTGTESGIVSNANIKLFFEKSRLKEKQSVK